MYANLGGVSRRASMVKEIRDLEDQVLLLDAGDIFQGTPYFNQFKGRLEMQLMSKMNYDAATIGNHDFDIGLQGFLKAKALANFPFICSNYDFSNTILEGSTVKHQVFQKGKVKIGIFGLGVELDGLVPKGLFSETKYLDPIEIAQEQTQLLKKKGCDLIICLSHLGYQYQNEKISDLVLAEKTEGIHLIIGGHTHTFLTEPTQVINKNGELVLVNQVGWAGIHLGRIDFYFEKSLQNKSHLLTP
jgi:5'-nucleotidase